MASSTSGLGTVSASGVGSGLDVNSLVSQLVAAERAPQDKLLSARQSATTTQISALASVKSALSLFQATLTTMQSKTTFNPRTATTSDTGVLTASASSTAASGTYNVEVVSLASAHQLSSAAFAAGSTAVVGTGTLAISVGTSSFNVTIDSSHNTLAGIRDAINAAAGSSGVQATLVQETNGAHLVLTSSKTGAANAITVTQSGGDGNLAQLVYDPAHANTQLTQTQAAADSHIRIAGYDHYSATNTVSDAIDGVTLNLVSADAGQQKTLTVSRNTSGVADQVNAFVGAYNKLASTLSKLDSYDAASKSASALFGDAMLRGIENQLSQDLSRTVSGLAAPYNSLSSIGVTRQVDGTLAVDSTKLNNALTANPDAIAGIFSGTGGIATTLYSHVDATLKSNGPLEARNTSLKDTLQQIQDDADTLDARMEALQSRYMKQFTALDALLTQLQSTSSYLTTALASLPKPNSTSSSGG